MNYVSEVEGLGCIVARVVAKSCSEENPNSIITTFELEYPRFIHGELMTHRLFSRNAMSSRAVPVEKMIEQVRNNPATPIHWGKNQSGMQAKEECSNPVSDNIGSEFTVQEWWQLSAEEAAASAERLSEAGYHKQIVNRLLEPFQIMKTVVTTTELDNFFWLRCHEDAQPEFKELAECMLKAYKEAETEVLGTGEWHTPYVEHSRGLDLELMYSCSETWKTHGENYARTYLSREDALKVSSSCCAQVSYRVLDDSIDKAIMIYNQLVESEPVHASPFEHQATPLDDPEPEDTSDLSYGVTHVDCDGKAWSGNFKGWLQHRHLIKGNTCNHFDKL